MRLVATFITLLSISSQSFAAEMWGRFQADGSGCVNGVQLVTNGDAVAILFDTFRIEMMEGDRTDNQSSTHCDIKIEVTPPAGMELASFQQLFQGGFIKSKDASARMSVHYKLNGLSKQIDYQWPRGKALLPEDSESVFSKSVTDVIPSRNCNAKTTYGVRIHIQGGRKSRSEHLIGGIDSVDTTIATGLHLRPTFRSCRR